MLTHKRMDSRETERTVKIGGEDERRMARTAGCGSRTGLRASPSSNRPCLRSSLSACRGGAAVRINGGKGTNIHNHNQSGKLETRKLAKEAKAKVLFEGKDNCKYEPQQMQQKECCGEMKVLDRDTGEIVKVDENKEIGKYMTHQVGEEKCCDGKKVLNRDDIRFGSFSLSKSVNLKEVSKLSPKLSTSSTHLEKQSDDDAVDDNICGALPERLVFEEPNKRMKVKKAVAGMAACGRRTGLRSSPSSNCTAAANAGARPYLRSSSSACRGGTAAKSRPINGGKGTNIQNHKQSGKPETRKLVTEAGAKVLVEDKVNGKYETQQIQEDDCCGETKVLYRDTREIVKVDEDEEIGKYMVHQMGEEKCCDGKKVLNRRMDVKQAGQVGKCPDAIKWDVTLLSEPPAERFQPDPPVMPPISSFHPEDFARYSPKGFDFQLATVYGCPRFPPYMIQSVQSALIRYADKNGGPVLKLVEIIDFNLFDKRFCGFTLGEYVHHINVLAQYGDDPSHTMLFFAEGHYKSAAKSTAKATYAISLCCPLDSNKAGATACGFCSPSSRIKHPPDGGFYGAADPDVEAPPPGQDTLSPSYSI